MAYSLSGFVAPGFQPVAAAFAANFRRGEDSGAAMCVQHRGRTVVDLWGGMADDVRDTPWGTGTLVCLMGVKHLPEHAEYDIGYRFLHGDPGVGMAIGHKAH